MWFTEIMTEFLTFRINSYGPKIFADAIKIISALIVAQSLLKDPHARRFMIGKYISLKNNFEDENNVLV
jgi:hypothetical protein